MDDNISKYKKWLEELEELVEAYMLDIDNGDETGSSRGKSERYNESDKEEEPQRTPSMNRF